MKKKEKVQELIKFADELLDEQGNAVLDVNLSGFDELYNPLSIGKNRDLNDAIYEFIDAQANIIPATVPLRIRFHGNFSEQEQDDIRKMMHRHYTMRSYDNVWDEAANSRKVAVLSIVGLAFLAAYFYFAFTSKEFFAEILSIIGSFSVWEVANSMLLETPRLKRERKNIEQNITQKIEFVSDDELSAVEEAPEFAYVAVENESASEAENDSEALLDALLPPSEGK